MINSILLRATIAYIREPDERRLRFEREFYGQLRVKNIDVDRLFSLRRTNMDAQGEKLFAALQLIVDADFSDPTFVALVKHLGDLHRSYGVEPSMYTTVGEVLLATFATFMENAWTPAIQESWSEAITLLAGVMIADEA